MNEYERLTIEVREAVIELNEAAIRLENLEKEKEVAWNSLEDVRLAHFIHASEHCGRPDSGYCSFKGCNFYSYDSSDETQFVDWMSSPAEQFLEQARGVLKILTFEEAIAKFPTK